MRDIQRRGPYADTLEARSPQDPSKFIELGVRDETFQRFVKTRQVTKVAQYYGIVQDGLTGARHAFRGLRRPLYWDGDRNADQKVIIYSWRPAFDYVWLGSKHGGAPERRTPPPNLVFVVLVQGHEADEHGVSGSLLHWNWVAEDPTLPLAPTEWNNRYGEKLWSR